MFIICSTLWCIINVPPPLIKFWKILTWKWSNYDMNCVINCQIMILYLDFVVVITFYVQTLLFFLTPQLGSLPDIILDPPPPFIKHWRVDGWNEGNILVQIRGETGIIWLISVIIHEGYPQKHPFFIMFWSNIQAKQTWFDEFL